MREVIIIRYSVQQVKSSPFFYPIYQPIESGSQYNNTSVVQIIKTLICTAIMKVLFGIINSLVRFLQQNIKLNRILLCCVITSCWKCTESFNVQRSSLEIQNTQSTITMPEFTTEESMFISRPGVKNHEAILKQCEYFPTKRLRELCERIAENPIIVAMKEHARGHLKETLWTTSITKSDMPLGPQQGIKCPQYSYDTLPNVASLRSLSPWKMMPEYDRLR